MNHDIGNLTVPCPAGTQIQENAWNGIDYVRTDRTVRLAAEETMANSGVDLYVLTRNGICCWSVSFSGGTPATVIEQAAALAFDVAVRSSR